ncbi:methyltransferase domain-containing protein [Candidatus Woesearchaeota archaeon]|nr:methyltransferase domain-containing protein [Candidatus Woesearchaeota archaeon]
MVKGITYSEIASSYNELYKDEQIKKLSMIKRNIKIAPVLLDVGCGTGISTNYFNVKSVGIDNCKEMLNIGRNNGYNNLIYGNAEDLPFKNKSFNTVISVTGFHNFKDMEKALKEVIRVSKNGNIAVSFLKSSSKLKNFRTLIVKYFKKFKEIEDSKDILFIIEQPIKHE